MNERSFIKLLNFLQHSIATVWERNVVHEICADERSNDEVMISELEECDEIENSDTLDTRRDPSGSDEQTPTTSAASATSLSWTCDDISPHIFPFTNDCEIKISLPVTDTPFLWLKVFLDDRLINIFTIATNRYAHQYLSTNALSERCHKR